MTAWRCVRLNSFLTICLYPARCLTVYKTNNQGLMPEVAAFGERQNMTTTSRRQGVVECRLHSGRSGSGREIREIATLIHLDPQLFRGRDERLNSSPVDVR